MAPTSSVDNTKCINRCSVCDTAFPPLLLSTGPETLVWECRSCGAAYQGKLARNAPSQLRRAIRPRQYFPEIGRIRPVNEDLRTFADQLVSADLEVDRRGASRKSIMLAVPTIELDDEFYPASETVTMVSRDISSAGISLINHSPVNRNLAILLNIPGQGPAQLVLKPVRCLSVGNFYEIAGYFTERL